LRFAIEIGNWHSAIENPSHITFASFVTHTSTPKQCDFNKKASLLNHLCPENATIPPFSGWFFSKIMLFLHNRQVAQSPDQN